MQNTRTAPGAVSPDPPTYPGFDHLVQLSPQARTQRTAEQLIVFHRYGSLAVPLADRTLTVAMQALSDGPVAVLSLETEVLAASPDSDQISALARLHWLLSRLGPALVHVLSVAGTPVLRVAPLSADGSFAPTEGPPDQPVELSRLAFVRRHDGAAVLESGRSPYRVELPDARGLALVAGLTTAADRPELTAATGLTESVVAAALAFLAGAGMTDAGDDEVAAWNFHELLFHARSRMGRHDGPFGATFPFLGQRPPVPPVKPSPAGPAVPLRRPDLDELRRSDPPLVLVQEGRRSVRHFGEVPISLDEVGEFLYRVGRIRAVFGPDEAGAMPYEAVDRPYPTGGAAGDLEIYLTAHRVQGLAKASYHYDAAAHRLVPVCTDPALVEALLRGAVVSTAGAPTPDVLLTFTSRFGRLNWKYDAMAYAATLKHVGVAYQTCYLVATAMRLAPCGLGSGDAALSARAFQLDWHTESSVGEFTLGSFPDNLAGTDPHAGRPAWRGYNDPQWATIATRALAGPGQP